MADQRRLNLLKHIASLEEMYPLQSFSPLQTGGVADFYTKVTTSVELASAVAGALGAHVPYLVIGQAQSILFSDSGFPGIIIHNESSAIAVAGDKSQVIVDTGMSLARLITYAASQGLGGLTYLYPETGSVGGAVYCNYRSIVSFVRYLTVLIPPSKLETEPKIKRCRPDWLWRDEGITRLQQSRQGKGVEVPQPVILTVTLQLTNVRSDELATRLHARASGKQQVRASTLAPLFEDPPGVTAAELIVGAGAGDIRLGNLRVERKNPNAIVLKGKGALAAEVRQVIETIQAKVKSQYDVDLHCRYEYLGVW